jgi:hypothetical protein
MLPILLALVLNRMCTADNPLSSSPVATFSKAAASRFATASCVYFVLYSVAGITVHPVIKNFLCRPVATLSWRTFRNSILTGTTLHRRCSSVPQANGGRRLHAGVVLSLCFSVLGGIAPLLLPNAYMPVPIRIAHSIEVGVSNFLYGLAVAWLVVPRRSAIGEQ